MKAFKRISVVNVMLMMLAAGCGEAQGDRATAAELQGGRAGEIALIPAVDVDGLEELTDRSQGTVFVEEVIMHARSVRLLDTQGGSTDLKGSSRYFLRYSPAAGEAGLTRLWAPADGQYSELALEVAPIFVTPETLKQEGRERGFDLSSLSGSSVLIRGIITVPTASSRGLSGALNGNGRQCGNSGELCEGTVPDTAPARGNGVAHSETVDRVDDGTVPDTAPARDDVNNSKQGLASATAGLGGLPEREFHRFVMVSNGSLSLGTPLDPLVAQGGGMVRLHLDVNQLFSDERLADLMSSAAADTDSKVLTRSLRSEEVSKSFHVQAGEVAVVKAPANPH